MQILLIGRDGQLSSAFYNLFLKNNISFSCTTRKDLDLSDQNSIKTFLSNYSHYKQNGLPKIIINASAYTNVEKAEDESELALQVNGESNKRLADFASKNGYLYIYYSTDYVFDGSKNSPYSEEDRPNPINVYGRSKLKGEEYVKSVTDNFMIIRTSWVFSEIGVNFVKKMHELISSRDELKVISDQIGCPTSSEFIVDMTLQLLNKIYKNDTNKLTEIINICQPEHLSWFEFSSTIKNLMQRSNVKIFPIPSDEYKSKALRPKNSVLDTSKLKNLLDVSFLRSWRSDLEEVLKRLGNVK